MSTRNQIKQKYKPYKIAAKIVIIIAVFLYFYRVPPDSYLIVDCENFEVPTLVKVDKYSNVDIDDVLSSTGPQTMKRSVLGEFFASFINHSLLIYPYYIGSVMKLHPDNYSRIYEVGCSATSYYGYIRYPKSVKAENSGANKIAYYFGAFLGVITPLAFIVFLIVKLARKRK